MQLMHEKVSTFSVSTSPPSMRTYLLCAGIGGVHMLKCSWPLGSIVVVDPITCRQWCALPKSVRLCVCVLQCSEGDVGKWKTLHKYTGTVEECSFHETTDSLRDFSQVSASTSVSMYVRLCVLLSAHPSHFDRNAKVLVSTGNIRYFMHKDASHIWTVDVVMFYTIVCAFYLSQLQHIVVELCWCQSQYS